MVLCVPKLEGKSRYVNVLGAEYQAYVYLGKVWKFYIGSNNLTLLYPRPTGAFPRFTIRLLTESTLSVRRCVWPVLQMTSAKEKNANRSIAIVIIAPIIAALNVTEVPTRRAKAVLCCAVQLPNNGILLPLSLPLPETARSRP